MKIALFALNSSYVHTNLAVRCLSRALTRHGFETVIIEKNIKDKRLAVLDALYEAEADVYCFSAYIWNITGLLYFAAQLREIKPDCTIIFGGPEVSFEDSSFFSTHPYVDFIVSGEGEEALPELCHDILINGRVNRKKVIHAPSYDGFADEGIMYDQGEEFSSGILYYESCRGCPFGCSYCLSSAKREVRCKTPDRVLSDLLDFEKLRGNIKVIKFVDRTFNFDKKRAGEIWRGLLSDKYTKCYHFEVCADLLDEEALDLLSKFSAGKIQLEIGIQSTNSKTLEAVYRKADIAKCLETMKLLTSKGNVHIHADLIAGLPYEDMKSFIRSFDDVYGKCDVLQLGFLKLLKGSPIRGECEKYGIKFSPSPPYEILENNFISFGELVSLHKTEAILERFSNSGHFSNALKVIIPFVPSPFGFFKGLGEYIEMHCHNDSFSQINAYELLNSYAQMTVPKSVRSLITAKLRLDYLIWETGSCPPFLRGDFELPVAPFYKSSLILKCGMPVVPSTEVHRFICDENLFYVIDRKNHICKEWKIE